MQITATKDPKVTAYRSELEPITGVSLKMCGAVPPLPQRVFMAWCFVGHREDFTFTSPIRHGDL